MLLLVDAGNTKVKWALVEASAPPREALGRWVAFGSASHADAALLGREWRGLGVSRVLVSNVAGSEMGALLEHGLREAGAGRIGWFSAVEHLSGVRNAYREPGRLGSDRFAAMLGARALHPGQALVVANSGTATTIDALEADGTQVGGMILPGLPLMADALARHTAQLPLVKMDRLDRLDASEAPAGREAPGLAGMPTSGFGGDTEDAILCGCLAAQAGAVEHAMALLARRAGGARCILSGGAAAAIGAVLEVPHQIVDNLVMLGLQVAGTGYSQPEAAC